MRNKPLLVTISTIHQNEPRRLSCSLAEMPREPLRGCWQNISFGFIVMRSRQIHTVTTSRKAIRSMGRMNKKKKSDRTAKPFTARVMTPWSQANIASSYRRVTRSNRAVMNPATKMPTVRTEKGCMQTV
jgi:hypothetical protein